MPLSDLDRLAMQVAALFTHDADRRLRRINEPDGAIAPRFFLGRTMQGSLCRFRYDLPLALVRQLETLAASEPTADLRSDPVHAAAYRALLQTDATIVGQACGPAYHFPPALPLAPQAVMIDASNTDLLRALDPDLDTVARTLPDRQPWVVAVRQGIGVSACFCARKTARVAEAGVWTLAPFRRQGYALLAVASWARAVRAQGLIPLYSTSWANLASQGLAQKLGLVHYATDFSLA